jgi:hypothetical protein
MFSLFDYAEKKLNTIKQESWSTNLYFKPLPYEIKGINFFVKSFQYLTKTGLGNVRPAGRLMWPSNTFDIL